MFRIHILIIKYNSVILNKRFGRRIIARFNRLPWGDVGKQCLKGEISVFGLGYLMSRWNHLWSFVSLKVVGLDVDFSFQHIHGNWNHGSGQDFSPAENVVGEKKRTKHRILRNTRWKRKRIPDEKGSRKARRRVFLGTWFFNNIKCFFCASMIMTEKYHWI